MNDTMKPPPALNSRPVHLWPNVEQAQRAWAVAHACRLLAGSDHLTPIEFSAVANGLLNYVRGDQ